MVKIETIGFVGLGVMGEPMSANLVRKAGIPVHVYDQNPQAVERLVAAGGIAEKSVEDLGSKVDVVFLSLPSIVQVESVCEALLRAPRVPKLIVDMSTSEVARTRVLAGKLADAGVLFVDAPVARTKEAAVQGTLFITVGATKALFDIVRPLLAHMGSDVLHCGDTGCGQVVKILNNIMVFMTVNALSEVLTIGRRAGMDGKELFDALSKGSADSFALRNHGMKSLVPDTFPEKVFPVEYAIKDASLALALADQAGFEPHIARYTHDLLCKTRAAGFVQNYHPALIQLVDGRVPIKAA
ncbi:NAD(P)-dependent oxidoreductase [Variovorax sp. YR216]|uniref:NAD(P)-dependent oxidoreductase n=1 Tax=Variovorax sp. YR216 TaxID=1882828 RepID=UPI00089A1478|nr:NAD(P)-dependent oxidoreductase [Variovorax sp. YR216]SEB07967.1 3-hydroxyisobutyrate dehydrogenase [Variovorax sp. YR216]